MQPERGLGPIHVCDVHHVSAAAIGTSKADLKAVLLEYPHGLLRHLIGAIRSFLSGLPSLTISIGIRVEINGDCPGVIREGVSTPALTMVEASRIDVEPMLFYPRFPLGGDLGESGLERGSNELVTANL